MRTAAISLLLLVAAGVSLALWDHRMALTRLYALTHTAPPLLEPGPEGPDTAWFDDYFTTEPIDATTFAIGEPRFYQGNYNYLLLGTERALLFDSGPGIRDIRPVVESLTDLPVLAVPSHLHYDHIGNHPRFERIGVVDLPELRARAAAAGGKLRPTATEHLGFVEGVDPPDLNVTEWLTPGSELDLGGRSVRVLHTPGHTGDSISLFDAERAQLFTGDYVTEGALYAFIPGASLGDYLATANVLLETLPEKAQLLTAHRFSPPGAPILQYSDLRDLRTALLAIRSGALEATGSYPRVFRVNDDLELHADFAWGRRWQTDR
jgi:glyoxylase-like metal-dependent hydrolase (beta-lactamase superfamily II)